MAQTNVAIAWYTEEEWRRLKKRAVDRDELDNSYAEWQQNATNAIEQFAQRGIEAIPVFIRVKELAAWCRKQGRAIDGQSRAEFAARRLRQIDTQSADSLTVTHISKSKNPIPFLDGLGKLHERTHEKSQEPPYPYDEQKETIRLPKTVQQELKTLVSSGKKVQAIKRVVDLTGAGLRVAKDYVDTL